MVRFCPICGKSDEKLQFYGELCIECAKSRQKPLPPVKLIICQKCSAVLDKARKKKEISAANEITRLLKLKDANPAYSQDFSSVEYETSYGRICQPILILTEKSICVDCSRASSQYFEAIIQLRGEKEKVQRMADKLIKRISSRSFIPKIEELKEGIDIYCGSRSEAIAALNANKLGFQRTEKLAGEKRGRRIYRSTLLVRF